MATAPRNLNDLDIDGPDDLDKFVQDLMDNMVRTNFAVIFFIWWIVFGVALPLRSKHSTRFIYDRIIANSIQPFER